MSPSNTSVCSMRLARNLHALDPATTASMSREYEFFVTTDAPQQLEGPDRGRIRRLVMKNFFETKYAGQEKNTSAHNSASTVQASTKLKSRFRLSKPGQGVAEVETRRKRADGSKSRDDQTTDDGTPKSSSTQKNAPRPNSRTSSRMVSPAASTGSESSKSKRVAKVVLTINPDAHRFDPFDVLPVPGTPQLDMLFKLYKNATRANAMVINTRNTWWSFISNDAGLLHATLATWALYGTLVQGIEDMRMSQLKHKNEAIREISTKISDPGGQISDELVGTVSILASFENMLGAYNAAQLHIAALKRMVNARGGLYAFGHNDGLIRGIIWVDIHTATVFRTTPSFPRILFDPDTAALPHELLEQAAHTSPTCLLHLSLASIDCFNIFYRIHRLALAVSSYWIRRVSPLTLSNLLYETEYMILSVPDYSRDFLDFDLEPRPEQDAEYHERAELADAASIVEALLAATQIFIYAALREIPPTVNLFGILLERLRVALDRPSICMVNVWTKAKNMNILLWVIVMALSVADAKSCGKRRTWWVGRLSELANNLDIRSHTELEQVLETVAWTDAYFTGMLPRIWEEVKEYEMAMEGESWLLDIMGSGHG